MALLQSLKNLFKSSKSADTGLETAGKHWGERAREQVVLNKPSSWAEFPGRQFRIHLPSHLWSGPHRLAGIRGAKILCELGAKNQVAISSSTNS